jgi:hypothetical protein
MSALTRPGKLLKAALLAALTLGGLTALAGRGEASSIELRKHLHEFAGDIKKFLDGRKQKQISMGQFVGPPQLAAHAGPGLALLLKRELEKLDVAVKPLSDLGLSGEFRRVSAGKGKPPAFELRMKIVDEDSSPLQEFRCGIVDPADIALIVGAIGPIGPGTREARLRELWRRLADPRPTIRGVGRVYSHPLQPYAMEVMVEKRPRRPTLEGKLPFVGIARGESYAIRLHNNSDEDAAVLLAIDGINVFAFNEDADSDGVVRTDHKVIVRKRSTAIVRGWYRKNGKSDAFLVTKYSESAAGQLGATAEVGTITALFHEARKKAPPPPAPRKEYPGYKPVSGPGFAKDAPGGALGEPGALPKADGDAPGSGTGFGREVNEGYVTIGDRLVGPVIDVITVRYTRE